MIGEISAVAGAALLGGGVAAARRDLALGPAALALQAGLTAFAGAALAAAAGADGPSLWLLLAFLAPLAVIDLRTGLLPDPLTFGLICAALAQAAAEGAPAPAALGAAAGFVSLWAFGVLWRRLRGVEALGLGDAKLFAGIGAALGWVALPETALLAAVIGLAGGGLALAARGFRPRGGDEIPFGPALALAAWATALWGPFLT